MKIQSLCFLPVSGNRNYVYNFADLSVEVDLGHRAWAKDAYRLLVFSDELQRMADEFLPPSKDAKSCENSTPGSIKRSGNRLKATMHSDLVWIPGNYIFLVWSSAGELHRFDLTLDDHCTMMVTGDSDCVSCGLEDALADIEYRNYLASSRYLACHTGLAPLRQWIVKRRQEKKLNAMRGKLGPKRALRFNNNLLVETNVGHHSPANSLITQVDMDGDRVDADCATFVERTSPNPYEQLNKLLPDEPFYNRSQKVFVFYNIWALNDGGDGKVALSKILRYWSEGKMSAIFCGTPQEIDALLGNNPSLKAYFPAKNRIALGTVTLVELIQMFFFEAYFVGNLNFTPEATDMVCRNIAEAHRQGTTADWGVKEIRRFVRENLMEKYRDNAINAIQEGHEISQVLEVRPDDIDLQALQPTMASTGDLLNELNGMIGLDEVKQHIVTIANNVRFNSQRQQLGLPVEDGAVYHTVFTGKPGTGKTTVAKMMGRLFRSLGVLSKGDVICVERSKMVGEYLGQTEQIMKQILNEARGNVLFVDEAYTLYSDSPRDPGRIALECLLPVLASRHPDMVVVFAGYEQKMDTLFSMNDGLSGRFPYHFQFADYNADQLMQIVLLMLARGQYILTPDAEALLRQSIRRYVESNSQGMRFANARWATQLVSNCILPAMADRLMSGVHVYDKESYQTIQAIDVKQGCAKLKTGTVLPSRNVVGFRA